MKKIFLHIGLEKTGTSAIQYFLKMNRYALKKYGNIFIPQYRAKDSIFTHHRLAKSFFKKQFIAKKHKAYSDFELKEFLKLIKSITSSTIVISSELFAFYDSSEIEQLKNYLNDFEVEIILFLRRQDEYIEAQYAQHLKGVWVKGGKPIEPEKFTTHNLNYFNFIQKWKTGNFDNVSVKIYKASNNKNEIYQQFFEIIESTLLEKDWIKFPDELRNPSLSVFHLELMKNYIHKIKEDETRKKVANLLFYHNNEYSKIHGSIISNKQIFTNEYKQNLIAHYESSNKKVHLMYPEIGFNGKHLFQPFGEGQKSDVKRINHYSNQEIIECFIDMIKYAFDEKLA